MENEGTSALNSEAEQASQENKIIQFPGTKPDNITPFPTPQLPSEKIQRLEVPYNFDGGLFTMNISTSPSGFRFKTTESLTRFDENRPNPFTDEEKKKIALGMQPQMNYNQGTVTKEAMINYRQIEATDQDREFLEAYGKEQKRGPERAEKMIDAYLEKTSSPKITAFKEFQKKREIYDEKAVWQVGFLDPEIRGNEIRVKTAPRSFPITNNFQDISNRKEVLEQASSSATTGMIYLNDGNMLFSERDEEGSATYGGCIGVPASGYFDGELDPKPSKNSPNQGNRTFKPIETSSVLEIQGQKIRTRDLAEKNLFREMWEELGIHPKFVKKSTMTGLAFVRKKTTHEITYDMHLNISTDEVIKEMAKKREIPPGEFAEHAFPVKATPENIFTLCTKALTPLAPGHYAALAASGYRMVLQKDGVRAAEEYKKTLATGIRDNMERINTVIRQHLHENPQALTTPTERQLRKYEKVKNGYIATHPNASEEEMNDHRVEYFQNQPKLDINGYQPQFTLTEQGLPDARTALEMVGLISPEERTTQAEKNASPEIDRAHPEIAFVTGTFYPEWYAGEVKGEITNDKLRGDLTINSLKAAQDRGFRIALVDGGSSPAFLEALKAKGINYEIQKEKGGQGPARRQGMQMARNIEGVKVIATTEPEKISMVADGFITAAAPILSGEADIVVPNRGEASKKSYPPHQAEQEAKSNKLYNDILRSRNLLKAGDPDLDFWGGTRLYANKPEIRELFETTRDFKKGTTALDQKINMEMYSNPLFHPVVEALYRGLKVKSVNVAYQHPKSQTDFEANKPDFDRKRDVQRRTIMAELIHLIRQKEEQNKLKTGEKRKVSQLTQPVVASNISQFPQRSEAKKAA